MPARKRTKPFRELLSAGEAVVDAAAGFQLRPFRLVKPEVAKKLPSRSLPIRGSRGSAPLDATGSSSMSTTATAK